MTFQEENIPIELKKRRQWVAWKAEIIAEDNREIEKKIPIDPKIGNYASVTDPSTWGTFEKACDRSQQDNLNGIGFVFTADDPYAGIDLDNCRDLQSKQIAHWAKKIIEEAKSYTEISPSGKGVKIFLKGKLPGRGRHQGNVEMYDRAHYFTVTGRHLGGTPVSIKDRTTTFVKLYNESFQLEESVTADRPTEVNELTDAEIIERAKAAENGEKFSRLFSGDWESDYPSPSHGDQALAAMLAFWTRNPQRIDTLMRQSGLIKSRTRIEKWEKIHDPLNNRTYGQMTIDKALDKVKVSFGHDPYSSITKKLEDYFGSVQKDPQTTVSKVLDDQDIMSGLCFLVSNNMVRYEKFLLDLKLAGITSRDIETLKRAVKAQRRKLQSSPSGTELKALKNSLPDSPLAHGILVPKGWIINEDGVFKVNPEGIPVNVARSPGLIKRKLRNIVDGSQDIEVLWKEGGKWNSRMVDRVEIADARRIVNLADFGFPVTSGTARSMVEFLSAYEAANASLIPEASVTHQLGWLGKEGKLGFLCGKLLIRADDQSGRHPRVYFKGKTPGEAQIAGGFHKKGGLKEWKTVAVLIQNYPLLTFGVYAALAPPLMAIFDSPNFFIDWAGPTSTGKTTALQIAASCWGNPDGKKPNSVLNSWDATHAWLDRATSVYKNLPVFLDESQLAKDPELITKFIYLFSSGQGRRRGTVDGIEESSSWETIAFSTGESRIVNLSRGGGTHARVLSLWGSPFKGISDEAAELIRRIKKIIQSNYGHAGPRFVKYLINRRGKWDKWRQQYSGLVKKYQNQAGGNELALRQGEYLALIHMTAILAEKALSLDFDYESHIEEVRQKTFAEISRADKAKEAYESVLSWASSQKDSFWRSGEEGRTQPAGGWLGVWNPDGKKDYIAFMSHHLRDFLKSKRYEPNAIIQTWGDKGWILREGRDLTRKVMLGGERARCYFLKKEIAPPAKKDGHIRRT